MNRILWGLVAALVVVGGVFALWPELDLKVTHAFYDEGGFAGASASAKIAREFFSVAPFVVIGVMGAFYLMPRLGLTPPFSPDGRAMIFLIASMAIGPGLIVNFGMKDHLHRPRPVQVKEFGGADDFRPWYRVDGACKKNCGFPSGEGASAFWMVAPALLVPAPLQAFAVVGALLFGVAASALRMAFGGHFLSDVLFAALISLIVVFAIRRVVWPRGGP